MHGLYRFLVKMQAPVEAVGERAGSVPILAIPLDADAHSISVRLFGSKALAELAAGLASHHGAGAGKHRQVSVSGAVGENVTSYADAVLPGSLNSFDSLDTAVFHLHFVNGVTGKESDVGFGRYDVPLFPILVMMGTAGVTVTVGTNLVKYVSQRRIRRHVDLAAKADAHFRAVVSAQNVAVLQHYGGRQQLVTERPVGLKALSGNIFRGREYYSVGSAVEACKIVQGKGMLAGFELIAAALLPIPRSPLRPGGSWASGTELRLVGFSVHLDLEDAGGLAL